MNVNMYAGASIPQQPRRYSPNFPLSPPFLISPFPSLFPPPLPPSLSLPFPPFPSCHEAARLETS